MTDASDLSLTNPPKGPIGPQPPWQAIGMSRASWYRHGKPETKPHKRITEKEAAAIMDVPLRTLQRVRRVRRNGPALLPFVQDQTISLGRAEEIITGAYDMPDIDDLPDYCVLTRKQAAQLIGISAMTLDRLHAAGDGPERFWLSTRRIGYRLDMLKQWLDQREKASSSEPMSL
jgi:predicted DNA-binding transcriptional regulator AlpA